MILLDSRQKQGKRRKPGTKRRVECMERETLFSKDFSPGPASLSRRLTACFHETRQQRKEPGNNVEKEDESKSGENGEVGLKLHDLSGYSK